MISFSLNFQLCVNADDWYPTQNIFMTYYQLFSNDFRQQLLKNNFSTSFSLATVMNTPPIGALGSTVVITERAWFGFSPQIFNINNPLNNTILCFLFHLKRNNCWWSIESSNWKGDGGKLPLWRPPRLPRSGEPGNLEAKLEVEKHIWNENGFQHNKIPLASDAEILNPNTKSPTPHFLLNVQELSAIIN